MKTLALIISLTLFASCQRCWECEDNVTYRYKSNGEVWTQYNSKNITCDPKEKKERHNKTVNRDSKEYNIEISTKCKIKLN